MQEKLKHLVIFIVLMFFMYIGGSMVYQVNQKKVYQLEQQNYELSVEVNTLRIANEAILESIEQNVLEKKKILEDHRRLQDELSKAFEANPDWASSPVPASVIRLLNGKD